MEISFSGRGNTYFRHESSVSFIIDNELYWFTLIEEGDMYNAPEENTIDLIPDGDLPFELTEDMKDGMYSLL